MADRDVSAARDSRRRRRSRVDVTRSGEPRAGAGRRLRDHRLAALPLQPRRHAGRAQRPAPTTSTWAGCSTSPGGSSSSTTPSSARGVMAILGRGLGARDPQRARDARARGAGHGARGALPGGRGRSHPLPRSAALLGFGYSVDTLLDEYVMPSAVFRNGAFAMVPALDPGERVAVRFPAPVGRIYVDTTLHSEVATLPLSFRRPRHPRGDLPPGLRAEFMERLRFLVQLWTRGTQEPSRWRTGTCISACRCCSALHRPSAEGEADRQAIPATKCCAPWCAAVRRGRVLTVTADCHAGPKRRLRRSAPTSTPARRPRSRCSSCWRARSRSAPACGPVEQVVPPAPFLRELKRRGMRVTFPHPPRPPAALASQRAALATRVRLGPEPGPRREAPQTRESHGWRSGSRMAERRQDGDAERTPGVDPAPAQATRRQRASLPPCPAYTRRARLRVRDAGCECRASSPVHAPVLTAHHRGACDARDPPIAGLAAVRRGGGHPGARRTAGPVPEPASADPAADPVVPPSGPARRSARGGACGR